MVSMNRIGSYWTPRSPWLYDLGLRNGRGSEGLAIAGQASFEACSNEVTLANQAAGTNLWLDTGAKLWRLVDQSMNNTIVTLMRRAAKNIVFAISCGAP